MLRPTPATRAPRWPSSSSAVLAAGEHARVAAVEREACAERARNRHLRASSPPSALRDATQASLDESLQRRGAIEQELTGAAGERESALSVSYELRSRAARLAARIGGAVDRAPQRRARRCRSRGRARRAVAGGARAARIVMPGAAARQSATSETPSPNAHSRRRSAFRTLEQALAEREGIPPAALAEQGERLALSLLTIEPKRARGRRGARLPGVGLVAPTAKAASSNCSSAPPPPVSARSRPRRMRSARARRRAARRPRMYSPVAGPRSRARGTDTTWNRASPRRRDGVARARDATRGAGRRGKVAGRAVAPCGAHLSRRRRTGRTGGGRIHRRGAAPALRRADGRTLKALLTAATRLERALEALDHAVDVVEAPLRARGEAGSDRTAALGATLRQLGESEGALRRELAAAVEAAASAERDLSRLGGTFTTAEANGNSPSARARRSARTPQQPNGRELGQRARTAEAARIDAAVRAGRRRARPHQLARVAGAERLDAALAAATEAAARFEAPLRAHVDAGGTRTGEPRRRAAPPRRRRGRVAPSAHEHLRDRVCDRRRGRAHEAEADEARRRLEHAGTGTRRGRRTATSSLSARSGSSGGASRSAR